MISTKQLTPLKKLALVVAGSIAALLLFLWLALPGIIQSQAEKFIREKSGHRLTLDRPQFNPFSLELRLANLKLSDPEDKPLLAFREGRRRCRRVRVVVEHFEAAQLL